MKHDRFAVVHALVIMIHGKSVELFSAGLD